MSHLRPLRSMQPVQHASRFLHFAKDLEEAVQKVVPTDLGRYQKAAVLAMDWDNDTMNVKVLRDELLGVLRRVYNFKTESFLLKSSLSAGMTSQQLRDKLNQFTAANRPSKPDAKHLLIYYYSGHSDTGPNGDQLLLGGRVDQQGNLSHPHIDWYGVNPFALKVYGCETLLIMDSCFSGMSMIKPEGEILCATGWETTTPTTLNRSFTRFLIDEIQQVGGRAITASSLHANLLSRALSNNMSATPIHRTNGEYPSVLLHKIGSREAQQLVRMPQRQLAKVLITVSVSNNTLPSLKDWAEWLTTNMPTDINNVEIVANWNSASRTALVSVPIEIWDYLRDDPAYAFVSYVMDQVVIGAGPEAQAAGEGARHRPLHPGQPQPAPHLRVNPAPQRAVHSGPPPYDPQYPPLSLRSQPNVQRQENIRPGSSYRQEDTQRGSSSKRP